MSVGSLPTGLWDLTLSRIYYKSTAARLGRLGFAHSAKVAAQPALARSSASPPLPIENAPSRSRQSAGPLAPRPARPATGPLAEIELRVQALKEAADSELLAAENLVYSEEDLLAMYQALLAHPEEPPSAVPAVAEHEDQTAIDMAVVHQLEQQLLRLDSANTARPHSPLIEKLARDPSPSRRPAVNETQELHERVLQLANARLDRLDVLQSSSTPPVPIPLFTIEGYQALTRTCIRKGDIDAAESVLRLMKRSGMPIPEESLTLLLHQYTDIGDVTGAEQCLATFLTGPPTEPQRHLHVKCHLKATRRDRIPESALTVLHSYETQGCPAPIKTYTTTIAALYSTNLSVARAQAWDLFAHMRYVAHAKPDVPLYTAMIRACASPVGMARSAEPERALDLWTEMTVENRLTPTVGAYNAVILACAKSGRKAYVNEAFRIAKEMLDGHRDAYGRSKYLPDQQTLCALLEGAKRIGDLSRARWILADLVKSDAGEEDGVNEEIMMHVFHTYTSYFPPFTRHLARLKASAPVDAEVPAVAEQEHDSEDVPPPANHPPRFTHIPPQTGSEVIEEVQALFQRILEDTGKTQGGSSPDEFLLRPQQFKHVQLTVRLLNSYLSVHYQHASLESAESLFWSVFQYSSRGPDARSYVEALERCGRSNKRERAVGLRFAEQLWNGWTALENAPRPGRPLDARLIERAHAAFIRVLALTNHLPRALDQLKAFEARYPPAGLREPSPKASFRSTRTALVGARPLVRLTAPSEVPDDGVPPLMLFSDLELLHHRLVAAPPAPWVRPGIGYVKYIGKAYEWALRGRRDATMKARPGPGPSTPVHA